MTCEEFYTGLFCESQAFIKTNKSVQSFVDNFMFSGSGISVSSSK